MRVIAKKQTTKKGSHTMNHSLIRIVKWFCRQLSFNELASAVVIFLEVLNYSRNDIPLKPNEKPPHYREFRIDTLPPLPASEKDTADTGHGWEKLKKEIELKTGKIITPVQFRNGNKPPIGCKCSHCNAPRQYLYVNNGKIQSQVKCKICGKTSPTHGNKRKPKAKYRCPYCSSALFKWKESQQSTIFKCPSYSCGHYLRNKMILTDEEKTIRSLQKYNPNFKLHYQYREYHLSPDDLKSTRPASKTKVDLANIHNSYHTLGLVLTFTINLGLSSRTTRDALKGIFDISISHQTVINYINSSASYLSAFIDNNCPKPLTTSAADETYIIVDNQWTYTWFVIDSKTRAICAYNLSQHRGMQPALALLYNCFGKPGEMQTHPDLVTDGNPSYDAAVMAYNDLIKNDDNKLTKRTVVGLKNLDEESREYRSFKQLVERLNRTYKYHTRPRAGFKTFDGAVALTTLFVAFYNFMRPHSALKNATPVSLDSLHDCDLMPEKWVTLIEQAAA
ncbi:MAG: DDE-type integrase/transposase/recombinase [Deltaproteobacteria bacterium]|nr:DDE-type integrase/transposase/recombinase [Deltaproteobacteria bacterium]